MHLSPFYFPTPAQGANLASPLFLTLESPHTQTAGHELSRSSKNFHASLGRDSESCPLILLIRIVNPIKLHSRFHAAHRTKDSSPRSSATALSITDMAVWSPCTTSTVAISTMPTARSAATALRRPNLCARPTPAMRVVACISIRVLHLSIRKLPHHRQLPYVSPQFLSVCQVCKIAYTIRAQAPQGSSSEMAS